MIKALDAKSVKFSKRGWTANSALLSTVKKLYYRLIIIMYC